MALLLAKSCTLSGKKVIYIDTEGISIERLKQISGEDFSKVFEEFRHTQPYSMKEQERAVKQAIKIAESGKVGLIVVDSISGFYRLDLGTDEESSGVRSLTSQMIGLLTASRRYEVPVLITNQVYTDRERKEYRPIGGHIVDHYAKTIIRLERMGKGIRKATLMKHRSKKEGDSVLFRIVERGFERVEKD
jgi:DNA repair protein RadB